MPDATLRDLYQTELSDLYSAEQQIIKALPTLAMAAKSADLRTALEHHLERTRIHLERLDLLFKQQGLRPASSQSSGLTSLIQAGSDRIREQADVDVRDAAIISAAQHVEHYEMAGYGCARTYARQLGDDRAAELLQQTLDEEGEADKELTQLAESGINRLADIGEGTDRSDVRQTSRLRYVDVDDLTSAGEYRDFRVRNRADDDLGRIDGFVVDPSGRPYYLVVNAGGWFAGGRYIVPIGKTDLRRAERVVNVDFTKDTLKRYPEFHRDAFLAMSDEEARRYEWRVLEAIDPHAARTATTDWNYDAYPYYRQPEWYGKPMGTASSSGRSDVRPTPRRDVPMTTADEARERERIIAREEREPSHIDSQEGTPRRSDDKIR
jgi:ferritin-like metal-binding protein YciE